MEQKCLICGEPATTLFANNENFPLCALASCEQAFVDEINFQLEEAAAEAAKEYE